VCHQIDKYDILIRFFPAKHQIVKQFWAVLKPARRARSESLTERHRSEWRASWLPSPSPWSPDLGFWPSTMVTFSRDTLSARDCSWTWGQNYDHNFRRFWAVFEDFRSFSSISVNFCQFRSIFVDFGQFSSILGRFRRFLTIFVDVRQISSKDVVFLVKIIISALLATILDKIANFFSDFFGEFFI
jgi:hypothetical protein